MSLLVIITLVVVFYGPLLVLWKLGTFSRSPLGRIRGPPADSFIKGHMGKLFNPDAQEFRKELTESYGGIVKLKSLLSVPQLYVFDPLALHWILIKQHYIFDEPETHLVGNGILFGPGLVSVAGEHHKKQRKLLNPAFSPAHLRQTLPIMYQVTYRLRDAITSRLAKDWTEIDMLAWISRAALELIGQAGLGCSLDSLTGDASSPYGEALKSLVPALAPVALHRRLLPLLVKFGSAGFRRSVLEAYPSEAVQTLRRIIDIMDMNARRIVAEKTDVIRSGDERVVQQIGEGQDILSRLLQANMDAAEDETLSHEEIIGQVSTLVFAATDTTSSALSRILYLLAEHQDIQTKLREEVVTARSEQGDLSFDELFELPYLEAVCRETLRLYSPVSFVSKTAREDAVLPLHTPLQGNNGEEIRQVHVPKGTNVIIGIAAANRNKALWGEDALEWKPERWLSPLPEKLLQARMPGVYSNMMTFLGGGRACIGFKFSQCEMKVVLSILLEHFAFELSDAPITWRLASVQYPSVGASPKAQLPMRVKRI